MHRMAGLTVAATLLCAVATHARTDLSVSMALFVEYLPAFGLQHDVLDFLIAELGSAEPNVRRAAQVALKRASGKDFGGDATKRQEWRRGL